MVEAVRSALDQPDVDVEVLVQDAGSTDGSLEALSGIVDGRLAVISEPDRGQSDGINRALERASGEFVIWLNSDDLLAPAALPVLVAAARRDRLDVVHGNYEVVDVDGAYIKGYTSGPLEIERLFRHHVYIFSGAILVRRELMEELGGLDEDLHYLMDYDLLFRLARSATRKGAVPEVVALFRRRPTAKSEGAWLRSLREQLAVAGRHGSPRRARARSVAVFIGYMLLRPVWRSRAWLRVRPSKHLGGS